MLYIQPPNCALLPMTTLRTSAPPATQVVAGLVLLSNCYFITLSYLTICSVGGPMGYGLMLLPFLLAAHALLAPAALAFFRRWARSKALFVLNLIGLLYSVCLLYFLFFVPGVN